jgi:hypothetical protein
MKRRLAVPLISFSFLLASCGSSNRLPMGYLDAPKTGETVRATYNVVGWAIDESGIHDVSIYVDRNLAGAAMIGQNRPDLTSGFPKINDAAKGGFVYSWDTTKASPGQHELIVQARSNDGATRDVGSVQVNVTR